MIKLSCECMPSDFTRITGKTIKEPKNGFSYKWHIVSFPVNADKFKIILAIERAFGVWQEAVDRIKPVGRFLEFMSTDLIEHADILIFFGAGEHPVKRNSTFTDTDCPFPFDGKSGVLAHAWSINSNHAFSGQIHFDTAEDWSLMLTETSDRGINLKTVAIHEIGHVLDLGHSQIRDAIMAPSYTGPKLNLDLDDRKGVSAAFAERKLHLFKKYFQEKDGLSGDGIATNGNWFSNFATIIARYLLDFILRNK